MSALCGDAETLARLARHGVRTIGDVLAQSRCLRDLDDRSNHVLTCASEVWFVKRTKQPRGRDLLPREAAALKQLAALGVPTPALAFWGIDAEHGAITGTASLAPAKPLDALLAGGTLSARIRRRLGDRLAALVARLHDASLHHKDLYLNHLFADPADPELVVRVIDLERVARHRRVLGRWVVKDLAALRTSACGGGPGGGVSEREQRRFLLRYLRLRGLPRRGVVRGLARRIRVKAERMQRHVPRTPVGEMARERPADG